MEQTRCYDSLYYRIYTAASRLAIIFTDTQIHQYTIKHGKLRGCYPWHCRRHYRIFTDLLHRPYDIGQLLYGHAGRCLYQAVRDTCAAWCHTFGCSAVLEKICRLQQVAILRKAWYSCYTGAGAGLPVQRRDRGIYGESANCGNYYGAGWYSAALHRQCMQKPNCNNRTRDKPYARFYHWPLAVHIHDTGCEPE